MVPEAKLISGVTVMNLASAVFSVSPLAEVLCGWCQGACVIGAVTAFF